MDRENEQSRNGRRQRSFGGRRSLGENSDFSRRENTSLQGLIWLWANLLPPLHRSICRVGVTGQVSTAHSLARLLARPPAASLTGLSASPRHTGYASHLRSTEAPAPDAQLFTPSASSSRRKRCICHHKMDRFERLPVLSSSDCFPPSSFHSSLKTNNRLISMFPSWRMM